MFSISTTFSAALVPESALGALEAEAGGGFCSMVADPVVAYDSLNLPCDFHQCTFFAGETLREI